MKFMHYTVRVSDVNDNVPDMIFRIWNIIIAPLYFIICAIATFNNFKDVGVYEYIMEDRDDDEILYHVHRLSDAHRLMWITRLQLAEYELYEH